MTDTTGPATARGEDMVRRVRVVDSHTAGEPTRLVVDGAPDLGPGSAADRLTRLRQQHDAFRTAVVTEPRGSDVLVGALWLPSERPDVLGQVIFFNNAGYLGMCGHGTIGVANTLAWLGRIGPGAQRLETPVGDVEFVLRPDGAVQVVNVPAYRHAHGVAVETSRHGTVVGDIAWGGNWFFLVNVADQPIDARNLDVLRDYSGDIRRALRDQGVRAPDGAEIDHVELFGSPSDERFDSRNFVLCPGGEFDRSPCGTGTSAKLACLYAEGRIVPGQRWRQQGILGTVFEAWLQQRGDLLVPVIEGRAWVTSESTLLFDATDPFRRGLWA